MFLHVMFLHKFHLHKFFFHKGGEQDFNKDLEKNIIDEINKKYKELLLELNYLKN